MWTTLQTFFLDFAPCYSQLCLNSQPVKKCEGEKTKHEGSFVINFCFCFIAASPMLCTSKYYQKLSRVLRSFSLSQFSRLIIMIWTFIGTKITPHIIYDEYKFSRICKCACFILISHFFATIFVNTNFIKISRKNH